MNHDYETMTDEEIIEQIRELNTGSDQNTDVSAETVGELMTAAKAAADRGNAEAQFYYGGFLLKKKGTPEEAEAAGKYLLKSAEQGYAPAQNHIGICYQSGAGGLEKNPEKALEYFRRAAEQGYAESMVHLYVIYRNREGTEQNKATALQYLRAASDADYYPACVMLGMELLQGSQASPERQEEGVALLLKAAEGDDPIGQLLYATCCENGFGMEKDLSDAAGWYRRAAKAGNIQANEALKRLGFPGVM